ncbi:MAG: hypothetical protein KC731_23180 [Myxococcales bacterium]|nr:hypothetical protein [Myxococcales bacterium]
MKTYLLILASLALLTPACDDFGPDDTGSVSDAVSCDTDADCGTGEQCEVEDQGSFCKSHGGGDDGGTITFCATDADCAAGEECELEHGVLSCKPHGGEDGTGTLTCNSDADCAAGEECEFEHGGSFCKPHGGA